MKVHAKLLHQIRWHIAIPISGGGFIHDTKTKWTTELNCSLQVTLGPQKLFGLEISPPYEKQ